jgi:molecular chaperone GrpE
LQNGTNTMTDPRRAAAEAAPDAAEPADAAPANPADPGAAAVEALVRENAELKDRLLRTLAEMENLRRRTERDVVDARTYAIASFARDMLGIADNMARALQTLRAELKEKADSGVKVLLEGVELTERELAKVLEKHGVRKFEPQEREKFDPNLHQAMYEVPDPSLPSGTIAQVVQAGYMIGDRMLRPALVAVAKGGPKQAPAQTQAADPIASDNADAEPS